MGRVVNTVDNKARQNIQGKEPPSCRKPRPLSVAIMRRWESLIHAMNLKIKLRHNSKKTQSFLEITMVNFGTFAVRTRKERTWMKSKVAAHPFNSVSCLVLKSTAPQAQLEANIMTLLRWMRRAAVAARGITEAYDEEGFYFHQLPQP